MLRYCLKKVIKIIFQSVTEYLPILLNKIRIIISTIVKKYIIQYFFIIPSNEQQYIFISIKMYFVFS